MNKVKICINCLSLISAIALVIFVAIEITTNSQHTGRVLGDSLTQELEINQIDSSLIKFNTSEIPKQTKQKKDNEVKITFSFEILPVRFVYINEEGGITRIWNNTENKHQRYVLKFFKNDTEEEVEPSEKHLDSYYTIIQNTNNFYEGDIFDLALTTFTLDNSKDIDVKFLSDETGEITEVHTLT